MRCCDTVARPERIESLTSFSHLLLHSQRLDRGAHGSAALRPLAAERCGRAARQFPPRPPRRIVHPSSPGHQIAAATATATAADTSRTAPEYWIEYLRGDASCSISRCRSASSKRSAYAAASKCCIASLAGPSYNGVVIEVGSFSFSLLLRFLLLLHRSEVKRTTLLQAVGRREVAIKKAAYGLQEPQLHELHEEQQPAVTTWARRVMHVGRRSGIQPLRCLSSTATYCIISSPSSR
jgi:hypothetical protein